MAREIRIRRGTNQEHQNFTGALGEITMDITEKTLRVHDGETVGGIPLARADKIPQSTLPDGYDCIIESGGTSAAWWRKYKSGWCEQGGYDTTKSAGSPLEVIFPLQMRNNEYTLMTTAKSPSSTSATTIHGCHYLTKTENGCKIICLRGNSGDWTSAEINWFICGYCK